MKSVARVRGGSLEEMSVLGSWLCGLRALRQLSANPDDTEKALEAGLHLNKMSFPRVYARFVEDPEGRALLRERPAIDTRSVDLDALGRLPEGTLGREYARFLQEHGLSPDIFQKPAQVSFPDAAYVAQRLRQSHDLWHVLTGYKTDISGEIELQAFTYGQLGIPSAFLIACLGTIRFAVQQGQSLLPRVLAAYRRGRGARFLGTTRWEELWATPLGELREKLGTNP